MMTQAVAMCGCGRVALTDNSHLENAGNCTHDGNNGSHDYNLPIPGREGGVSKHEFRLYTDAQTAQTLGIIGFVLGFAAIVGSIVVSWWQLPKTQKGKVSLDFNFDGYGTQAVVLIELIIFSIIFWFFLKIVPFSHRKYKRFSDSYDYVRKAAAQICTCFIIDQLRIALLGLMRRPIVLGLLSLFAGLGNAGTDSLIFIYAWIEALMLILEFAMLNDINLPCCSLKKLKQLEKYEQLEFDDQDDDN